MTTEMLCVVWLFVLCLVQKRGCSPIDTFLDIQEEFGQWQLQMHPEFTTSRGLYKYNDQVESYDWRNFEMLMNTTSRYMERLKEVPYDQLPLDHQIDFDILNATLLAVINGYPWRFYGALSPITFMFGPQISLHRLVQATPFQTHGDFINYIDRMKKIRTQIDEMIGRMRLGMEKNVTSHRTSMWRVSGQIANMLGENFNLARFSLGQPFKSSLDNITTISRYDKTELKTLGADAAMFLHDKLQDLRRFIEEEYSPNYRQEIGVGSWNNGKEFYKAALKWHLTLDMSPEEVHELGRKEVKRIHAQMLKILSDLGFNGTLREFYNSTEVKSFYPKMDKKEILYRMDNIINTDIRRAAKKLFSDVTSNPITVDASPHDGPYAFYVSGSEDGKKPAVFFLNLMRPDEFSMMGSMAISLHETIPGHHQQFSLQFANTNLPTYRRYRSSTKYFQVPFLFSTNTAFVEGWGLYAEYLGEELGLYNNWFLQMGRYSSEIFRACRLVVDTGIHYFNWSRDEAINYLLDYANFGLGDIESEVDRYITIPGQACSYKIGEIKILELRQLAETELGKDFDIKKFHSEMLRHGPVGLDTMDKIIRRWILQSKSDLANEKRKTPLPNSNLSPCGAGGTMMTSSHVLLFINFVYTCIFVYLNLPY